MGAWRDAHWESSIYSGMPRRERASGPYRWYVPDLLQARPIVIDGALSSEIASAERSIRRLNGPGADVLASVARYLLRSEAIASSRIEGVAPSTKQVALAELSSADDVRGLSEQAHVVANNLTVVGEATTRLVDADQVTVEDIEALHRALLPDAPAQHGLRTVQNWIGGADHHPIDADFVPPAPELVRPLMHDLVGALNGAAESPLVQAALVHAKDPTVEDLAALMDEQHRRIGPAMAHLRGLALDVVAGRRRGAVAAADLCRAVVALVNVLHLHLSDEERLLMPRVEELLTEREWQDFDRHNLDRGPLDLAFVGHWLLDGLQDVDDRHIVTRQVPLVVAWIVLNLMGGPYRQHRRTSWSGTPAERIGASPLPRLPRPCPAGHDTASTSVDTPPHEPGYARPGTDQPARRPRKATRMSTPTHSTGEPATGPVTPTYVIAGGRVGRDRLRTLSGVLAQTTGALLDHIGIPPTARCLDAGCGGGDVARLLSERCPAGMVVGVDRDPVKIELARAELGDRVDLRVEDIADTVCDGAAYDVVYARFLLSHLPDAGDWVRRLSHLLSPGGVLVVEDLHISGSFCAPASAAHDQALRIYAETVRDHGGDPDIGPQLPRHLLTAGLTGIGVNVVQPAGLTGDAKQVIVLTQRAIADTAVASGILTWEEMNENIAELQAFVDRSDTVMTTAQIVQTWGRLGSRMEPSPTRGP